MRWQSQILGKFGKQRLDCKLSSYAAPAIPARAHGIVTLRKAKQRGSRAAPRSDSPGDDVVAANGLTVRSASPWKTILGTVGPARLGRVVPPPPVAAKADGMSRIAPQANPEWRPTAANRSGYVAAMITA